jgi:clan AA aspartic protease
VLGRLAFDRTPCVLIQVSEAQGEHEFVVDTGFSGSLYLPDKNIVAWRLPFIASIPVVLADQTTIIADAYECTVTWFDTRLRVTVLAGPLDCDSLVGMELLEGCRIDLDGPANEVRIDHLWV